MHSDRPAGPDQVGVETGSAPKLAEWLAEAFSLFGQQWGVWIGHGALWLAGILVPVLLGAGGMSLAIWVMVHRGASDTEFFAILVGIMATSVVIAMFVVTPLTAGAMYRSAMKQLRGERIGVGDVREVIRAWPSLAAAWLLLILIWTLGAPCVLPFVLLYGLTLYVPILVIERRMGAFSAIRESFRLTLPHLWLYAVWGLIIILVQGAGSAVVIGMIATYPISILMAAVGYWHTAGQDT
jgi:hypothetical protein